MIKFPNLKCPICGKSYKDTAEFGNHMRSDHPGTIPADWSDLRYAYFVYTGKDRGHCRECGGDTPWNEVTGAYAKICGSEVCKKRFRDRVMAGMRARYGKVKVLDDPKFRERMLTHRKISGEYTFHDGGKVAYMGTLEKEFLKMLDTFFRFPSADIMSPSPNRYRYICENPADAEHNGEHWYVPDFYIPSCNLEIELKAGNNQRPRNLMIDVRKDAAKDVAMIRNPLVNFVKIYETDYHVFFQVFADISRQNETGQKTPIKYISRTLLTSIYRDYIPDDALAIIDKFIYKYSEKSVMKPAKEGEVPILEEVEEAYEEETPPDSPGVDIDEYYSDDVNEDANTVTDLETNDTEVGVNPMMYYQLFEFAPKDAAIVEENFNSLFTLDEEFVEALEASLKDQVDTKSIDGRAALRFRTWKEKLFGSGFFGQRVTSAFTKVRVINGNIEIKGINCNLLLYRIKETFSEGRLKYIFEYRYNDRSWKLYQKKKIGRGDMKIDYVYAPEFFCIELVELFTELSERYHDHTYKVIAQQIYDQSWMSTADTTEVPPMSTEPLSALRLTLLPHQIAFIEKWPQLKHQLNTNGYVLAFKPGKGKTLTAVGLAECLHAPKIYIVCPNNLKDNWALELKKYYAKYDDAKVWADEVCILGSNFGNPETARWIITNNENIKLMYPYAKNNPDAMLILDECHNFRNYNGTRSGELFTLADKIGSKNVLCVSATPIKAVPAEIAPALHLIDPTFTNDAAAMYVKCFDLSSTAAMGIVNKRFGKIIYRPADVQVDLPPINLNKLELSIADESRFYLETVHNEVIADYTERHEKWLKSAEKPFSEFTKMVHQFSMTSRSSTNEYIRWVRDSSSAVRGAEGYHELAVREYETFINDYIRPNPNCSSVIADSLQKMQNEFVTAAKRDMGYAVGTITHTRRSELFIELYEQNKDRIYSMIRNRTKKTIIFSTIVPVVKHIFKDLDNFGIGAVAIYGEVRNRMDTLRRFKEDPNCLVLVATSWCLSEGVTLTEASQMFFFGTPWRSAGYEQAYHRIWRIGQTDTVDIYNVLLKSRKANLSSRMSDILEWSDRMFNAAINANELDGVNNEQLDQNTAATEAYKQGTTYQILNNMMGLLKDYKYGLYYNGKIVEDAAPELYDKYYRTASPGKFLKHGGGICFDFAAFQDFYCKSHSLPSDTYFIEVWGKKDGKDMYVTHAFTLIRDGAYQQVYPEMAFSKIEGIWIAKDLSQIVSFIVLHITEGWSDFEFECRSLRTRYGAYDETMDEFMQRARSGQLLPIKFNKNQYNLSPYFDINDWHYAAEHEFNLKIDSPQYSREISTEQLRLLHYITETYYRMEDSSANPCITILEKKMDDYYGKAEFYTSREPNPTMSSLYSPWELAYFLHSDPILQKAQIIFATIFFQYHGTEGDGLMERGPIIFPLAFIPFSDGAIYIEHGINPYRNGIYFVSTIAEGASAAAHWLAESHHLEPRTSWKQLSLELRMVPVEAWDRLKGMGYQEAYNLLKQGKLINIEWNPYTDDIHRVEVLGSGWIVERY